jgi:hypothetical protein
MRMTEMELKEMKVKYMLYGAALSGIFVVFFIWWMSIWTNTPPEITCICAGVILG